MENDIPIYDYSNSTPLLGKIMRTVWTPSHNTLGLTCHLLYFPLTWKPGDEVEGIPNLMVSVQDSKENWQKAMDLVLTQAVVDFKDYLATKHGK